MILRSPLDPRFPDLFFALDGFVNARRRRGRHRSEQDANGGYLETRLTKVHDRLHLAMSPALGIVV
jgi:hypothetical protein